jgi:hypothetical protein
MRFKVSRLHKLENTKYTNKIFLSPFPVCLELRINYTPLTVYEQEYLSYKAYFDILPRTPYYLRLFALKVKLQIYFCGSYRPVHEFIKYITLRLQVHRVRLRKNNQQDATL